MLEKVNPKILLVEDEKNVGSTLLERLKKENFDLVWVETMISAFSLVNQTEFDLALLDIGLPDGNGLELAEKLRQIQPFCGIIFLTAYGNAEDRIRGLELGAEDYIVKPFHLKELILRIRNGLKRAHYIKSNFSQDLDPIQIGKAKIFFPRFEAESDGKKVSLTHKETALLKLMIERRGLVISRDEILDSIWSENEFPTPRTVDNFILRLRKLVEINPEHPQIIKSVRGIGYQLI